MKSALLLFATTFLMTACSTLPTQLVNDDPALVTDYAQWDASQSHPVRLGGVIADVKNLDSQTRIEIVNLPISSSGKPDITQEPNGRYVAYVPGFVDPVSLAEGRLITTLGQSAGVEEGKVGDYLHQFPVMKQATLHLWRIEERVIVDDFGSYMFPCRGYYCRDVGYRPREGRVIQEVK